MSSRKKPDTRALFKQAKNRQGDGGVISSSEGRGTARAEAGGHKYKGKSKQELLAIWKLKQAHKFQKVAQESQAAPARTPVGPQPPTAPAARVAKSSTASPPEPVRPSNSGAASGVLTGLLGVGADDSSDEDEEIRTAKANTNAAGEVVSTRSYSIAVSTSAAESSSEGGVNTGESRRHAASVPEGLPAGFFDDPAEAGGSQGKAAGGPEGLPEGFFDDPAEAEGRRRQGTSVPEGLPEGFFDNPEGAATAASSDASENNTPQKPSEVKAQNKIKRNQQMGTDAQHAPERGLDLARAAQLEAEAAVEAERDQARLAAMRAAGELPMMEAEPRTEQAVQEENVETEDGTAADAAGKGTALPEGFFDDPEVDAKSRGIDLKAKKKEEEQNDWKDFMVFADEVKKREKEQEQREEQREEDKEQYDELEQATMMGRLAVLMSASEGIGRKRKRQDASGEVPETANAEGMVQAPPPGASKKEKFARNSEGQDDKIERSVTETGSAMREVAVSSAPADAAAVEISAMIRGRRRKKKKEVEEAFAGEYVPMDPLDWRAKGR